MTTDGLTGTRVESTRFGDVADVTAPSAGRTYMMPGDWCTTEGARRLKDKIEAYWKERGYDVSVELVDAGFMPAMRSARTDVRSNLVNGLPPREHGGRVERPKFTPRVTQG